MEKKQQLLIYGKEYDIWRDGKYIGKATWTDDENIGDAFIQKVISDRHPGEIVNLVYMGDEWDFAE